MGRVNMEKLREEEKARKKKYIWDKPLIIAGRIIESIWKTKERKEN